jgi:hypothetical protein
VTSALNQCAVCHQVTPERPNDMEVAALSFMEIANQPGRERRYFRRFLAEPHWIDTVASEPIIMPALHLSEAEREDVISLILSYQTHFRPGWPAPLAPFE